MGKLNTIFLESAKLATNSTFVEVFKTRCPRSFSPKQRELLSYSPVQISCSPYWMGMEDNIKKDKLALLEVINKSQKKLYMTTYEYYTYDKFTTPPMYFIFQCIPNNTTI